MFCVFRGFCNWCEIQRYSPSGEDPIQRHRNTAEHAKHSDIVPYHCILLGKRICLFFKKNMCLWAEEINEKSLDLGGLFSKPFHIHIIVAQIVTHAKHHANKSRTKECKNTLRYIHIPPSLFTTLKMKCVYSAA